MKRNQTQRVQMHSLPVDGAIVLADSKDGPVIAQVDHVDYSGIIIAAPIVDCATGKRRDPRGMLVLNRSQISIIPEPPHQWRRHYGVGERCWCDEYHNLLKLLCDHCPPNHPVRSEFEKVAAQETEDWDEPDPLLDQKKLAVESFYRQSQEEQSRIANGWSVVSRRPTPEEQAGRPAGAMTRVATVIDSRDPIVVHDWRGDCLTVPAQVQIPEYTTKADVLREIDSLRDFIDSNWAEIISGVPLKI